jgi:hypothetical protein
MAYKKTANLNDSELDEQIAIQEQGIADKRICTPIRLNNLLDERIRRCELKIAIAKAELNQMTSRPTPLEK